MDICIGIKEANTAQSVRLNPRTEAQRIWLSAEFLTCSLAGERRCAEKALATVEDMPPLLMLEQLCARALPKVPEREIERRRTSEGCRKAPGTGRLPAPPHTCVGEDRIGIQGGGKSWIFISEKSIY